MAYRFDWIDEIVVALKAKLVADLPALLAEIEADRNGVTLAAPSAENIWTADKTVPSAFPSIEIWGPDSVRQNEDTRVLHYRHRLAMVLTITGTEEVVIDQQLRLTLLGMLMAVDGMMCGPQSQGQVIAGTVNYTTVQGTGEAGQPWVRSGAVEVSVDTLTDTGRW